MSNDSLITIRIDQEQFQIDMQDLTWGEAEVAEEIIGGSLADHLDRVKGVLAIAYLAKRRKNPLVSLDELRALPMTEIEILEGDDSLPPTQDDAAGDSGSQ